jgi:hypothetical protein
LLNYNVIKIFLTKGVFMGVLILLVIAIAGALLCFAARATN